MGAAWAALVALALAAGLAALWGVRRMQRERERLENQLRERTLELHRRNESLEREIEERERVQEKLRLSEQQLHQAQKMEALGRLAGGIAHDFNNLLTAIAGYCDGIQEELPADHPSRSDLDQIQKAGRRASRLTQQLLGFSRKQLIEPRMMDLNRVVLSTGTMLQRMIGERVRLETRLCDRPPLICADRGQMDQILMNLAVNARDAMPEGGTLTISTDLVRVLEPGEGREGYDVAPGLYARLTVRDTGTGMSAEVREHVFEPFFTTKDGAEGTGLGLSTVFGIVKQNHGYVEIETSEGEGTAIVLDLPAARGRVEDDTESGGFAKPDTDRSERVLLVEDEVSLRLLLQKVLERRGFEVTVAAEGEQASEIAARNASFDLLITDVVMPGVDGAALARDLRERNPEMQILFISGYGAEAMGPQGVIPEGAHFLAKPFRTATLLARIEEILGGPAAGS